MVECIVNGRRAMNENEKDCTDQLIECHSECDVNDKECRDDCVEEYQECDISQEFTSEDVEQCITDGTDYKDCVDHMVATMPINEPIDEPIDDEGDLIAELLCITTELGGTMERLECSNSTGRTSKVIKIEYNVKHKNET